MGSFVLNIWVRYKFGMPLLNCYSVDGMIHVCVICQPRSMGIMVNQATTDYPVTRFFSPAAELVFYKLSNH